jgi:hypothetical protein
MKSGTLFLPLVLGSLLLTGCEITQFDDKEIKGILSTDKSAMGNEYLEVTDSETKVTRFIHPGKKIISVDRTGAKATIKIYDGRRVLLATVKADLKDVDGTSDRLYIPAERMGQNWDLVAFRTKVLLRRDVLETRASRKCSGNQLRGSAWNVEDFRHDYEIEFAVPGTGATEAKKLWARFHAHWPG